MQRADAKPLAIIDRVVPRLIRLLPALGAFFVLAFALSACGDSVPGNAVVRVADSSITRTDFNRWFGIAAAGNPATAVNKSSYDPPNYAACVAKKTKTAPKPAKGQPATTPAQYKAQCKQEYEGLRDQVLQFLIIAKWIAGEAKRSSLLGRFPVTIIPNGLDVSVFRPRDKAFSRDTLEIPHEARVVLFAADSAAQRRKGFTELAQAIEGINGMDDLVLVSVGGGKPTLKGHRHVHVGRLSDDRLLAMAYSAADVFVIPSLQESFGQTVIESLACGTPVVGFASGGIPDMVRPGQTGWLAPTGDVAALRRAIVTALNDSEGRARMAGECRRVAVEEYSLDVQASQYIRLYESLRAGRAAAGEPDVKSELAGASA